MSSHVILSGSHREHPADSVSLGQPAPDEIIQLTLILRRENANLLGAATADVKAVEAFAAQRHFSIVNIQRAARSISISGPLSAVAAAFKADLRISRIAAMTFRTRRGALQLPQSLDGRVIAILGFDQRPAARARFRVLPHAAQSYTPQQVAQLYNFPTNAGKNQTIALIELGGGFNNSDAPNVSTTAVSVDGAQNSPTGDPNSADGEVALDIQVAGGIASGALIAVYFAPNTDRGFLDGINAAIHDTVRKPSVISISWGSAESEWTPQSLNAYNAAFHDAALLGISVCAAAGDGGSSDGETDGNNHVDFPASSPWVLGCGGTKLVGSGSTIQSEIVWNDGANGGATGGGVSSHFSRPAYQARVNVPKPTGTVNPTGRGVPDVAGDASPETGYTILVDGQPGVFGGTSAVAPLWAALIALFNEQLGKNVGWPHPALYGTITQHKALHDIVSGTNGSYKAAPGWDPCTGLGSPNGQAILALLKK